MMISQFGLHWSSRLTLRARQDVHQLGHLAPLLLRVTAGDGVLDAMGDVILQYGFLNPAQGGARGIDLRQDIDAIAVFLHHSGYAAHLPFDPAKAAGA
jgi:hypothetical protein